MARPGFAPRAEVAARRARVLMRRIEQVPYVLIAAEEGISESTARMDYQRALEAAKGDQSATTAEARALELIKLDAAEREAWRVLRTRHITVSQGRIVGRYTGRFVRDEDGEIVRDHNDRPVQEIEEIEDDAPVLQALDRLNRIAQRRAALRGLDAPVKVEVSDAVDAELERLAARLGVMEPGREDEAPGDAEAGREQAGTA